MRDSQLRSIVKSICWRITGILLSVASVWIITGKIVLAIEISFIYHLIRTVQYYLNERFWEHIKWQRYDYRR